MANNKQEIFDIGKNAAIRANELGSTFEDDLSYETADIIKAYQDIADVALGHFVPLRSPRQFEPADRGLSEVNTYR